MKKVLMFGMTIAIAVASQAYGSTTVTLGDHSIYWLQGVSGGAGTYWAEDTAINGTYQPISGTYSASWKNTHDVIGGPDLAPTQNLGLDMIYDEAYGPNQGQLLGLKINYTGNGSETLPGDLFIDMGNVSGSYTWDLVIRTPYGTGVNFGTNPLTLSPWSAYEGSWDYGPNADKQLYDLAYESKRRNGSSWTSSYVIRTDNPWRLDNAAYGTALTPTVAVGGSWQVGTGYLAFDLSGLGINLLDASGNVKDVTFGFAPNCSNDVIFESAPLSLNLEVPEPASLAIWSAMLLGAAGLAARRRRNRGGRWVDDDRQAIRKAVHLDR